MKISDLLLGEFDHEMAVTRRTLDRIPDDKFSWKPHEKSMSLGRLAGHIAEIPGWLTVTLIKDSLDMAPGGVSTYKPPALESRAEVLALFDKNVADGRETLQGFPDDKMDVKWSLLNNGKAIFTMPRAGVVRAFIVKHAVHHRAQMGVYLRMNNIPVPSVYGPSADES